MDVCISGLSTSSRPVVSSFKDLCPVRESFLSPVSGSGELPGRTEIQRPSLSRAELSVRARQRARHFCRRLGPLSRVAHPIGITESFRKGSMNVCILRSFSKETFNNGNGTRYIM